MATSDLAGNAFPKALDDSDRTEWVPLSLTLVEYPKGTHAVLFERAMNERLF